MAGKHLRVDVTNQEFAKIEQTRRSVHDLLMLGVGYALEEQAKSETVTVAENTSIAIGNPRGSKST